MRLGSLAAVRLHVGKVSLSPLGEQLSQLERLSCGFFCPEKLTPVSLLAKHALPYIPRAAETKLVLQTSKGALSIQPTCGCATSGP